MVGYGVCQKARKETKSRQQVEIERLIQERKKQWK